MRRRHVLSTAAGLAAAAVLSGCDRDDTAAATASGDQSESGSSQGGSESRALETVYPAGERPAGPALAGTLLDATTFDPATLAGKVVVVNFWASWCPPCRAETDDLEAVYQATHAAGVTFLGINIRDSTDAAASFVRGRVGYPSFFDPSGEATLQFQGVSAAFLPTTVLLDRQNRIAAVYRKAIVQADLEPVVTALAAEKV